MYVCVDIAVKFDETVIPRIHMFVFPRLALVSRDTPFTFTTS